VRMQRQRPTSAASGDRQHEVGIGTGAVGVAGRGMEQQQQRVPVVQELVGVFGDSKRLLGIDPGGAPVADAELQFTQGAQRERQAADETPSRARA
jgi:hypothetical protein